MPEIQFTFDVKEGLFGNKVLAIISTEHSKQISDDVYKKVSMSLDSIPDLRHRFIIGAMLIEEQVNDILKSLMPDFEKCCNDSRDFTFHVRVRILESFGILPPHFVHSLDWVKATRNKFAHDLTLNFSPDSFASMADSFKEQYKRLTNGSWDESRFNNGSYSEFILLLLVLLRFFHVNCAKYTEYMRSTNQLDEFARKSIEAIPADLRRPIEKF